MKLQREKIKYTIRSLKLCISKLVRVAESYGIFFVFPLKLQTASNFFIFLLEFY